LELNQQDVLIIGGTSGLGYAAAELARQHGARVSITGRTLAGAEVAASRLGPEVRPLAVDLTNIPETIKILEGSGEYDVVIVTAGVTHFAPTEYEDPAGFAETINANLTGTFFAVRQLASQVRAGGRIVLTTTVLAKTYFFGASALSASRAGLSVVLRTFAKELAPRGIRVNAVSVGPIDTPAWEKAGATEEDRGNVARQVALQRLGKASEVAEAILFLASTRSSYITGHELAVDGGWALA
jgi:NAD(P)-dependent dehydrogenase (short-subunit alcohol dehydrogenase family)